MTKYIYSSSGNTPVVISVPHGGYIRPREMESRKKGCFVKDDNLISVALGIKKSFAKNKIQPNLVYSRVARIKVDLNRDRSDAQFSQAALKLWKDYHSEIERAIKRATKEYGRCLYIDLHGQSTLPYVELGYGTKKISEEMISDTSFGGFLSEEGIRCFPSREIATQAGRYRSGGFSINYHKAENVEAIQVEINKEWRINSKIRKKFAEKFSEAITKYLF
jgi:N-formylglutamate amidohydrolase